MHYIAGVCSALYLKEALDWAAKNGGATGENVANGVLSEEGLGAGRHGRRLQSLDLGPRRTIVRPRPSTSIAQRVSGATDGDINDLMAKGTIKLEKVKTIELPRKADWFGW